MKDDEAVVRRAKILIAARWCFLNFGFAKTAFEDIAKRANLSRTLREEEAERCGGEDDPPAWLTLCRKVCSRFSVSKENHY
ncbi:MAG TPA: TetR/AcrR family transcriptional regulator [Bryobacteraceae bacterium]